MWNVVHYQDPNGRQPVREELDKRASKEDMARLKLVIQNHIKTQQGTLQPRGAALHTVEEFWQIRTNQLRILCCFSEITAETLVMLHAFKKKVQRTPAEAITRARNMHRDYRQEVQQRQTGRII